MHIHLRDVILGGQDGLVNVLGIILAMAGATQDVRLIIISGLAATFAESLSMVAVGYTSSVAVKDVYNNIMKKEEHQSKYRKEEAKKEIIDIYKKKGFKGTLLNRVVNHITSNKKLMVDTMMKEEHDMTLEGFENPIINAAVIGMAALIGSVIPLLPFFIFDSVFYGMVLAVIVSVIALFFTGAYKAKLTGGRWLKEGIVLSVVGMGAAGLGYGIGLLLGLI